MRIIPEKSTLHSTVREKERTHSTASKRIVSLSEQPGLTPFFLLGYKVGLQ